MADRDQTGGLSESRLDQTHTEPVREIYERLDLIRRRVGELDPVADREAIGRISTELQQILYQYTGEDEDHPPIWKK